LAAYIIVDHNVQKPQISGLANYHYLFFLKKKKLNPLMYLKVVLLLETFNKRENEEKF
jgi:hypothetical protein